MPQMSPLNWLFLYFYTMMILLFINVILNYLYLINDLNKIEMKYLNKIYYKWMW